MTHFVTADSATHTADSGLWFADGLCQIVAHLEQPSGGWAAYNAYDAERQRRKRKQLQDEEDEREALADRLEAQLASEGLIEADPVVAQRIVVREYAHHPDLLNRRAQRAVDYALRAKTELAWQLAAREIAHQEEDEEIALLLLLAAA